MDERIACYRTTTSGTAWETQGGKSSWEDVLGEKMGEAFTQGGTFVGA